MPPCARKRPPYASQVVEGKDVALALRCLPAHDAVFDQTDNFPPPPRYQASASYNCFRFVDSVMHFKPEELNVLPRPPPAQPATCLRAMPRPDCPHQPPHCLRTTLAPLLAP